MKSFEMTLMDDYVPKVKSIYGEHLIEIIVFGSYARNEAREDSDIDIMILLDLSDTEIKEYRHQLSELSFDFLMDYDMDIKPIAKNVEHFLKWKKVYPFYSAVDSEGVRLYEAA